MTFSRDPPLHLANASPPSLMPEYLGRKFGLLWLGVEVVVRLTSASSGQSA
jgi:hypothetical protein